MNARRSFCRRRLSLAAIFATLVSGAIVRADAPSHTQLARGKDLFTRTWSGGDEISPKGDGLGPLFNADSCVACHALGGVGGAGPNSVNVQLLTVTRASPSATVETVQARLQRIHPAFVTSSGAVNTTIVLHRHSTERGYRIWREDLLNMEISGARELDPLLRLFPMQIASLFVTRERQHSPDSIPLAAEGLEFEITERNTPALFGAAIINGVNDKLLAHIAQRQAQEFSGITGRVPRSIDGRVGRFGWRGQVATLQDFVQNACATELGLQLPKRSQAGSPLAQRAAVFGVADKKKEAPPHTDMDARQVMDLTGFVMRLPRPRQTKPNHGGPAALSHVGGERIFNEVGCAACHMRKVGKIDGLYSDLLLHDMGPDLSDPAAAIPPSGPSFSSGGYYSGGALPGIAISSALAELRREWRTPPLWGVSDSAPYLHDGRAATIEEAVRAHGGEAEGAAKRFRELTAIERDSMLTFLATLEAP